MEILTKEEKAVQSALAEIWEKFKDLPEQHEVDTTQFYLGITDLQRIVLVRPIRRLEGLAPSGGKEDDPNATIVCAENGCPVQEWLTGELKLPKGTGMKCSKCGTDYTAKKWIKLAKKNSPE